MDSIAGKLLVASRALRDPNFARSVVLMLEHTAEGALGLVINRPSPRTVAEIWSSIGEPDVTNTDLVYLGGPVPGPLVALHKTEELGEKQVLPGLYMSVQKDSLEQLVRTPDIELRLYSGHSGWGSGQLEGELKAGGWLVGRARVGDVFAEGDALEGLWGHVLARINREILLPQLPADRLPPDPHLN
jgi:putative transcriptional regulator